jgi:hypothetical protein
MRLLASETGESLASLPRVIPMEPLPIAKQRASNSLGPSRVTRPFGFPRPRGVTSQLPTARRTLKVDAAVGR